MIKRLSTMIIRRLAVSLSENKLFLSENKNVNGKLESYIL